MMIAHVLESSRAQRHVLMCDRQAAEKAARAEVLLPSEQGYALVVMIHQIAPC